MEGQVVSLNLRYNEPRDGDDSWPNRVGHVVTTLLAHRPLLVGTQEGLRGMLEELAAKLPGYAWIGEGRRGGSDDEHCAIFYDHDRLELLEQGQFWLSEQPGLAGSVGWDASLPRICTWAKLRDRASGLAFRCYNTHLDHQGVEARLEGARLLGRRIADDRREDRLPALLTGDFNSFPGDAPIRLLRGERDPGEGFGLSDAYAQATAEIGATYHAFQGGEAGEPIDYVFATEGIDLSDVRVDRRSVDGRYPSDHYPIVVAIALRPPRL
ncbi:endonuclease/exonuclease/phosphatase family protein [Cohnella sp. REN36]|uniref:endonuclease/exonuclease/phosphatase family protein n=1 Tax=Cohnella sp. REN36 TaxID=2887347 RepID=UPI001D133265|nr:endonuclease/exonuclease/phosphatase family protein [Cohnella sp. REN36]MCC3371459.1 endonuclease/exonuclease/phosphatase family protein [Cohnella sp. REN36]